MPGIIYRSVMHVAYFTMTKIILEVIHWLGRAVGAISARKRRKLETAITDYMAEHRGWLTPDHVWREVSLRPIIEDVPFSVAFPPTLHGWAKFKFWLRKLPYDIRHKWRMEVDYIPEDRVLKVMRNLRRKGELELAPTGESYRLRT